MKADTPESCRNKEGEFSPDAWQSYTLLELGSWVHLLATRAGHRTDPKKKAKDLQDAQNYLDMMQSKLDSQK